MTIITRKPKYKLQRPAIKALCRYLKEPPELYIDSYDNNIERLISKIYIHAKEEINEPELKKVNYLIEDSIQGFRMMRNFGCRGFAALIYLMDYYGFELDYKYLFLSTNGIHL